MPRKKQSNPHKRKLNEEPSKLPDDVVHKQGHVGKYAYSAFEMQGRRDTMEDAHHVHDRGTGPVMVGVFDGHGGTECVDFVVGKLFDDLSGHRSFQRNPRRAMTPVFRAVDDAFCAKELAGGTTATVAALRTQKIRKGEHEILTLANTGDTRAVLVQRDGSVVVLTRDHHPTLEDEQDRILDNGGQLFYDSFDVLRVGGCLAVSRAFGNRTLKPYVTAEPEVVEQVIQAEDKYLCIATDGLWETVKNDEVGPILQKHGIHEGVAHLAKLAFERNSSDNICVLVVDLQQRDLPEPADQTLEPCTKRTK